MIQINQKVLRRQLQSKGYVVTPANNGREAVAAVEDAVKAHNDQSPNGEETKLSPAPFDVILMDQVIFTMSWPLFIATC